MLKRLYETGPGICKFVHRHRKHTELLFKTFWVERIWLTQNYTNLLECDLNLFGFCIGIPGALPTELSRPMLVVSLFHQHYNSYKQGSHTGSRYYLSFFFFFFVFFSFINQCEAEYLMTPWV